MSIRSTVMEIRLVDNHAHPVMDLSDDEITQSFSSFFTEGSLSQRHASHTLNYRVALDHLFEYFDVDEEASALQARSDVDLERYSSELIERTGTDIILADDGFPPVSPSEFEAFTEADIYPIKRIETVAEDLIPESRSFDEFESAFESTITEALESGYVGLKSVVAYRTGLEISDPNRPDVESTFQTTQSAWDGRLESKTLLDYLAHKAAIIAAEQDVPIQFHTGFGDEDAHPRNVDPTYLFDYLKSHPETDVVLLHGGYPYVRNAGYVTGTIDNVYLDLSLATPFIQHGVEPMIAASLELAPTTKLLYGSDAFTVPELYLLAATRFREDLATVLEGLVDDGYISTAYGKSTAENILRENAIELYDL